MGLEAQAFAGLIFLVLMLIEVARDQHVVPVAKRLEWGAAVKSCSAACPSLLGHLLDDDGGELRFLAQHPRRQLRELRSELADQIGAGHDADRECALGHGHLERATRPPSSI